MVGVGLMGMVSLGIMQIMKESRRVTKGSVERIQIEEVTNKIDRLFRDPEVCRSTLFGKNPNGDGEDITEIIKKRDILDIEVHEGATPEIDGSEISEYNSKSIEETYIRADCSNQVGSASKPCTYGGGRKGKIFLKELKILAYEMTHSTSGQPTSPYRNLDGNATVEMTLLRGSAIGKGTPQELEKAREQTYGQLEIVKRISIPLILDRTGPSGRISDCNTELRTFAQGACDQLSGVMDIDERCKNIQIQAILPEPPLPGPPYREAITTKGDTQVNRNLTITNTWNIATTGVNAPGNVNLDESTTVQESVLITEGKLNLGTRTTLESKTGGEITIYKNSGDNSANLKLGSTAIIKGFNSNVGIQTVANPTNTLEVQGDANISQTLDVDGDLNANQDLEMGGVATFRIVGNTLQLTGVEFELDTSVNNSFYSTQQTSENDLIAKRKWVYEMFRNRLGDSTTIKQVIDELMSYSGSNQLRQVQHALCVGIKNATWTGSQCRIPTQNSLCSSGRHLRGFSGGNIICDTPNLGNFTVGSNDMTTGFNSNGTARTNSVTNLIRPETDAIANRQENCFGNNRAYHNKYNVKYDIQNNSCTASSWVREFKEKGCGHQQGNNSSSKCRCHTFGSGWYYYGHSGCTYNWVVTGYKCKCARDL